MIYVEGRLRTRSYTDQAGVQKYTTEVVADNIQLLSRRPDEEGAPAAQYGAQPRPAAQPQNFQPAPAYQAPQYGQPAPPIPEPAPAQPAVTVPAGLESDPSDDLPF